MKRIFIVLVMLLFASPSYAFIWTGNTVSQANDTPMALNYFHCPLGGPVSNQYIRFIAQEFTVEQATLVDYLFVDSVVSPWEPDPNRSEYWEPQWMGVSFRLYDGSLRSYGSNDPMPSPGTLLAETETYRFGSVDGHTARVYDNFQIPLRYSLQANESYWLWANVDQYESQASMTYKLAGNTLVNPEPSTMFLFGIGLLGMIRRKK